MVSEEPTDGRCNAPAGEDKAYFCESYPVLDDDGEPVTGRCRMHNGFGRGGAAPDNANHLEHGLRSRRPNAADLYPQLPERGKERVDSLVDAYVERWGWDDNDPRIESRLLDVCVDVWRRWRAKGVLVDMGPNEERVIGVNDRGKPVAAWDEHHLHKAVSRVDTDIRQNLNDLAPDDPPASVSVESDGPMTVNFNIGEVEDDTEFIDVESEAVDE
jgi:hypothetical protein